jgi:hypothetical protein
MIIWYFGPCVYCFKSVMLELILQTNHLVRFPGCLSEASAWFVWISKIAIVSLKAHGHVPY